MSTETIIIHGWSDSSASFARLKQYLVEAGVGPVNAIVYGDYESQEDNLTFEAIADAMNNEFFERGYIDRKGTRRRDLNVVVHSTGGLVIRHWIWRYYTRLGRDPAECPVRRVVMLAPANFGSPLAHRGKSFLGSVLRGRRDVGNFLEVGRHLLEGLELASPYQWRLAHGDLLTPDPAYRRDRIQATILVGAEDYRGLRSLINKPGTDGTVVIAGASLDTLKLTLDCTPSPSDPAPYRWSSTKAVDDFAFGVVPGLNHTTIVSDVGKPHWDKHVGRPLVRALTAGRAEFAAVQEDLGRQTDQTYRTTGEDRYQQFIVHAIDDQDTPIVDYTMQFFVARRSASERGRVADHELTAAERRFGERAHALLTSEVHTHTRDPSFRRLLVAPARVKALLADARAKLGEDVVLSMRLHVPRVDRGIHYNTDQLRNIVLAGTAKERGRSPTFLYENTTTLLELRVDVVCTYFKVRVDPLGSGG